MQRITILAALMLSLPAIAQDVHHHEGMSPEVDQFYSTWLRPNGEHPRVASCCNFLDCYPAEAQFRGGHWFFKHRETQTWKIVPDGLVEHEQADPRESPDGGNHVCASPYGHVYCFTVGLQT
jgi:hypothetical protein